MRCRFTFPLVWLLLGFFAWSLRAAPLPSGTFAFQTSDLPVDAAVRWGRLDNGVRYAILHNAEPKGRASLRFGVTTGSFEETDAQRGLAHFLEHLAFNGSTHFPPGTLVEYFQRLGMSFGGDTNAFTSFDRTEYQLELPDVKPDTIAKAFTLFADYGGGLLLKPESIEKERGIILSEERARDSVGLRSWKAEMQYLLPDTIVPQRLPIGSDDVIRTAGRDRFADYYDAWYRPENFIVVAVGDFDVAAVEAQLKEALSDLQPRAPARARPDLGTVRRPENVEATLHTDPDAAATTVTIENVAPYAYEPDTAERRLRLLPRDLAIAMLNRRLSILAKKEGAPFASGEAAVGEAFDFFRSASIELTCQPKQWRAALGVAEQELRRALEHGFQAAELKEATDGFRNGLEQAVASAATRPSPVLAGAIVNAVIDRQVFDTPAAELALFKPALVKVSVDDCLAALRAAWSAAPGRRIFVSGNLTLADPAKEIVSVYDASRAVPVAAPEKQAEAAFAYTDFGPAGAVKQRREVPDLGATLLTFENGVRLNLKHTDFEAGRIGVSVRIGGGRLSEPKSEPGIEQAAGGVFTSGGLGRHSIDDLQRILASKTVALGFAVGDDAFELSGGTNRTDLLLQLQLLAAYVTDPGFRPEAMRQFKKGVEQVYLQIAHTVEGPLGATVPRLMADGDPRFGLPAEPVMQQRTTDEVRAWLAPQLAHGPIEIAIVGDLDVDATIAAVARTFGALPAREPKPAYAAARAVSYPARPLQQDFTVTTELARGVVQMMWPATDRRDVHVARRLQMLAAVFGDRLRLKLREQMGGTYSPDAGASLSEAFPGYGFIVARAAISPEKAPDVVAAIKSVAADLARNGVTADELERARQPTLTLLRTSERENSYWLGIVLGSAQEHPEHLDWCRSRYADNEAITKADLDAFAARYLPPERASVFVSVPEKAPEAAQAPATASPTR